MRCACNTLLSLLNIPAPYAKKISADFTKLISVDNIIFSTFGKR